MPFRCKLNNDRTEFCSAWVAFIILTVLVSFLVPAVLVYALENIFAPIGLLSERLEKVKLNSDVTIYAMEDDYYTLVSPTQALRWGARVVWTKNGAELEQNKKHYEHGRLRLQNLTTRASGIYHCSVGDRVVATFHLIVLPTWPGMLRAHMQAMEYAMLFFWLMVGALFCIGKRFKGRRIAPENDVAPIEMSEVGPARNRLRGHGFDYTLTDTEECSDSDEEPAEKCILYLTSVLSSAEKAAKIREETLPSLIGRRRSALPRNQEEVEYCCAAGRV
ncbi:unnamed protein product, partial [Mesorhabditis spiculigera]